MTDQPTTDWAYGTSYTNNIVSASNMSTVGKATVLTLMSGNVLGASIDAVTTEIAIWKQTVNVEAGKTYTFSFDYAISLTKGYIGARIDSDLAWKTLPITQGTWTLPNSSAKRPIAAEICSDQCNKEPRIVSSFVSLSSS